MKLPVTTELRDWNRFMAVNANNLAWDLSTKNRSEAQDQEMLNAAHTAAFHWNEIGTAENNIRATMLLAEVYGLLGYGSTALQYAKDVDTFFSNKEIANWERAFVYIILSRANKADDNQSLYREYLHAAQETISSIEDIEERKIVSASMPSLLA